MNAKALYKISYGLYVVSSKLDDKNFNAQISNTVFQVTSEPKKIALAINKQNLTYEYLSKSRVVGISVLSEETPLGFIGRFGFKSGRDFNKFEGINYKIGITGAPLVLDNATAVIEGKIVDSFDLETHSLFIAEVVDSEIINENKPMTYEYYHKIKQGFVPKTAPTYNEALHFKSESDKEKPRKYKCKVCGYVYDPEKGDETQNVKPGTKFKELPENWKCPVCGVSKEYFEVMEM
jgi:rubredoxin/flavin reductase (DIM6/NTAB) family NADH-FMN oxidoreductase RutF